MLTIQEIQALRTQYATANAALNDAVARSKQLSAVYASKNDEVQKEIAVAQENKTKIEQQLRDGVV